MNSEHEEDSKPTQADAGIPEPPLAVSASNPVVGSSSTYTASNLLERIAQQLNSKYPITSSSSSAIRDILSLSSSNTGGNNGTSGNAAQSNSFPLHSMVSDGSDSCSASPRELEISDSLETFAAHNLPIHQHDNIPWTTNHHHHTAADAVSDTSRLLLAAAKMQNGASSFDEKSQDDTSSAIKLENEDEANQLSKSPLSTGASTKAASSDENHNQQDASAVAQVSLDDIDAFARPGPNYHVVDTSKLPPVYSFFTRTFVANTGEIKAYCGSCRKHIASHKGDVTRTSNLIRHLKNMHPELHHEFQSTRSRYCRKKDPADDTDGDTVPPERSRARKTMRLDSTNSTSSNPSAQHQPSGGSRKSSYQFLQHQHSEQQHNANTRADALNNMVSMAPPAHSPFHNNNNTSSSLANGGSSTSSSSLTPHSTQNSPHNNAAAAALLLSSGFSGGNNGSNGEVDIMMMDDSNNNNNNEAEVVQQLKRNAEAAAMLSKQQHQNNSNSNAAAVHSALASMLALGAATNGGNVNSASSSANRAALSASAAAAASSGNFGEYNNGSTANNNNNNFAQRSAHLMHALGLATRNGGGQQAPGMPFAQQQQQQQQQMVANGNNNNNMNGSNAQNGGLGSAALLNLARNMFNSTTLSAGSLIGVPALIHPQLLYIMSKMGAGDELLFVPQNFAASTYAARNKIDLVFLNGLSLFVILEAVLRIFPIDVEANTAPVMLPQAAQNANVVATLAPVLQAALMRNYTDYPRHRPIFTFAPSREHMLNVAKESACVVIQTGERSDCMFMLLRKGSIIAAAAVVDKM